MNLSLLKELADRLFIKDYKDRATLLESIRYQGEALKPPTMDKTLTLSSKSVSPSPGKSVNNSRM